MRACVCVCVRERERERERFIAKKITEQLSHGKRHVTKVTFPSETKGNPATPKPEPDKSRGSGTTDTRRTKPHSEHRFPAPSAKLCAD